jgi:hypothetical protein
VLARNRFCLNLIELRSIFQLVLKLTQGGSQFTNSISKVYNIVKEYLLRSSLSTIRSLINSILNNYLLLLDL